MKNILPYLLPLFVHFSFGQVKIFEPNTISDNQSFGVAFSPHEENLLLVKAFGGRDSLQIHQSKKIAGAWQAPGLAFFSTNGLNEIDPAFSPDGNTILFNALGSEESGYDVFRLKKTASGWTTPEKLPDAINTGAQEFYATMASSQNIYFTRRIESNDLYVSHWVNNEYQKAIPLEGAINTAESESNPYISPDEDFIIFTSNREGGFGKADLYVSFNRKGYWSHPINLGEIINSEVSEFCPSMNQKNERFFFSRTVIEGKNRIENIYSIPLKQLELELLKKKAKWLK